ncbi:MAG: hypothetical protein KKA65_05100 [Nanoarchaeota archaeon]|nr:hypothetical protein [Nanoarchaeota archaeon]MBU4351770.1 hypothetical protein [Nanoarchaeota archaeon]MBU4456851.1 hypothetical protein [Nanoarchaeota archaeon]MCG2719458.1 hypothetical protein [Nanoarchaeota archaeon]
MFKKISNGLKKAGLIFLGTLIPYIPMEAQAQEATVQTQETSIKEGKLGISYGNKEQSLMGRDFAKGHSIEFDAEARIKINEKAGIKLDGLVRLEEFDYVDGNGDIKNGFLDTNLVLERYVGLGNSTMRIGFGVNFDFNRTEQTYENIKVNVKNITAGPVITTNIDSDYVDFNILLGSGFGKAGNDVQGQGLGIKPKLRIGLNFDLKKFNVPLRLENYGDIEITLLETENTTRNEYNLELGTELNYEIVDNLSVGLGYSHSRHYGNQDNVQSNTLKAGLKVEF